MIRRIVMRRELVALLPVVGLSGFFVINQGCATKPVLEEVQKELEQPKKNVAEAKENLKEAKATLGEARRLLEGAKSRVAAGAKARADEIVLDMGEEEGKEGEGQAQGAKPAGEASLGSIKVGWCDTLWDISEKVYNNSLYWPAIYELNRDKVGDDPWILSQGIVLSYKEELTEEEKDRAVKDAIAWAMKFKDRNRNPKCPPK